MAVRKPVVLVGGQLKELPADDTLPAQAPATHSHAISDVSSLQAALDGKQPTLSYKITVSPTEPSSPATGDIWISY